MENPVVPYDVTIEPVLNDFSEAWGFAKSCGMQLNLTFSVPITNASQWAYLTDSIAEYITINGVNMKERYENPAFFNVGTVPASFQGGNSVVIQTYSQTELWLLMLGGGEGTLDIDIANVISFSADMPTPFGVLGREITMQYDPETGTWAEVKDPVLPNRITVSVELSDNSEAWGLAAGTGMQLNLTFSKPFTSAGQWTYLTADLAQYITINNVNLYDRYTNPSEYNVGDTGSFQGGNKVVIQNFAEDQMWILLLGGGTGNLRMDKKNILVISKEMPMQYGRLARDIVLVYNPEDQTWTETSNPGSLDEEEEEPQKPSGINASARSYDFSSSWGIPAGTGFQIQITFTKPFTSEPQWTYFTDTLGEYISINGILAKDRHDNPADYGVAEVPENLWGGQSIILQNNNSVELWITMLGGGTGNLDLTKENTITIHKGFPFKDEVLQYDIVLTYDPENEIWVSNVKEEGIKVLDDEWVRPEENLITNFYSMYQPEVVYVKDWDNGKDFRT